MENKYSFVINNSGDQTYILVATCWNVDEEGVRTEVKSQTFTNLTLSQCFVEQSNFLF